MLPRAYLVDTSKIREIVRIIRNTDAPRIFDAKFLESIGFAGSNHKSTITVFKQIGLIDEHCVPTKNYYDIQNKVWGQTRLAELIKEAYSDLFKICEDVQFARSKECTSYFRQLCPSDSERVSYQKAKTFRGLCQCAKWNMCNLHSNVDKITPRAFSIGNFAYLWRRINDGQMGWMNTHSKFWTTDVWDKWNSSLENKIAIVKNTISWPIKELGEYEGCASAETEHKKPDNTCAPDLIVRRLNACFTSYIADNAIWLADKICKDASDFEQPTCFFYIFDPDGVIKNKKFFIKMIRENVRGKRLCVAIDSQPLCPMEDNFFQKVKDGAFEE